MLIEMVFARTSRYFAVVTLLSHTIMSAVTNISPSPHVHVLYSDTDAFLGRYL